jgi:hypothetical protein
VMADMKDCRCGHSAKKHIFAESALYGDCHDCRCELYDPPGGLKGVPIHPLFSFRESEFRLVSCKKCGHFCVSPEGVCESCWWDNDQKGLVKDTRPSYCWHSPTREHEVPFIKPPLRANYCRYCLKTIQPGRVVKRRERVMRFWKHTQRIRAGPCRLGDRTPSLEAKRVKGQCRAGEFKPHSRAAMGRPSSYVRPEAD